MTPEQEEQVHRALAAAARAEARAEDRADIGGPDGDPHRTLGHDDTGDPRTPLPADVAARLDAALEELLVPRVTAAASTGPDELARRRRRRWPTGLIAAAALCLIALAGGAAVIRGFGPTSESSSTSSAVADRSTPDSGRGPGALSGDDSSADSGSRPAATPGGRSPAPSTATSGPRELAAIGASPTFRTDTLARDIRRLLDLPGALPTGEPPAWRCVAPPLAAGEQLVGVRLDGRRSSLVLGAPTNGQRSAQIYSCADPRILVASTTVPSRDR